MATRRHPEASGVAKPLDTLWQASTLVWVLIAGEALALLLTVAPGGTGDRFAYFGIASFGIQWIFLTTLGLLYLLRRQLGRAGAVVIARVALGALLVSTWLVVALAWSMLRELWPMPTGGWLDFALRLTTISLTVGFLGLAAFRAQWRARQLALRAKQAEFDALQARIRPHFLFNALNTGIAMVHARPEATERLLLDLSDLFRAAISGHEYVTLDEELGLTRRYLEIEELRFGDRLEVRWKVPHDQVGLGKQRIPPLSIQPLVENAIKHGIEPSRKGGYVAVTMHATEDEVVVEVRNSLPAEAGTPSAGHGIGLRAVRSRIQAFTGGGGDVATHLADGEHVARLRLPRAG